MKKKFKCKIVHYLDKCYIIKYDNYYLFPSWKTLERYMLRFNKVVPELFSKEQAEYFCKNADSIIDIKTFNHEEFLDRFIESINIVKHIYSVDNLMEKLKKNNNGRY